MDEYHLYNVEVDVEVLTVHFQKGTMRVRIISDIWNGTRDVDATPFFEQFQVVTK